MCCIIHHVPCCQRGGLQSRRKLQETHAEHALRVSATRSREYLLLKQRLLRAPIFHIGNTDKYQVLSKVECVLKAVHVTAVGVCRDQLSSDVCIHVWVGYGG